MKIFNVLVISVLSTSLLLAPVANAEVPIEKREEVEKRKKARSGKAMGARIGKKVGAAYDLFSEEKVEEALEILLELEPRDDFDKAYVERFIGSMYAGLEGKQALAIERLKISEELDVLSFNDQASVIKLIADLSMQEKQYEQAIEYYKKYLEFTLDNHADTYYRMASSYYEAAKYAEIIEPARKAIKYSEKPVENHYVLVMGSYFERKMYPEATKALEDLVSVFPEKARWWSQLGMFYSLIEDYDRALSTMNVAYKNDMLDKESHFKQLAQLFATKGIPYKAAIVQEKHIASGDIKSSEQALAVMASTFRNAKEFSKAAKYYAEAAAINDDGDLFKKQGDMLITIENYEAALKAYDKALSAKKKVKSKGQVQLAVAEANLLLRNYQDAYDAIKLAKEDKKSAKTAKGWENYIKDAAERNGVTVK
jgi:tetratricopeptide (TPR) repeat protein